MRGGNETSALAFADSAQQVSDSRSQIRPRTVSYGRGSFPIARLNKTDSAVALEETEDAARAGTQFHAPYIGISHISHGSFSSTLRPSLLRMVSNIAYDEHSSEVDIVDIPTRTYADAVKDASSHSTPALSPSVSFGSPELSSYGADTPGELSTINTEVLRSDVGQKSSTYVEKANEGMLMDF